MARLLGDQITVRKLVVAAFFVVAIAANACGGSGSTTAPGSGGSGSGGSGGGSSGSCRTFPTVTAATTTALGVAQSTSLTGVFDPTTAKSTVTTLFPNGSPCSTTVSSYRSTADFVDEVRVVPGVTLALTAVTTTSGGCGSSTGTVTFSYDAQRRLTQFASIGGTTTYTAWDSSGRPTVGATNTGASIANVYDDVFRTLTQTQINGGTRSVSTQSFDANGIQTRVVVSDATGATTSTTTFTNSSTATVCK